MLRLMFSQACVKDYLFLNDHIIGTYNTVKRSRCRFLVRIARTDTYLQMNGRKFDS